MSGKGTRKKRNRSQSVSASSTEWQSGGGPSKRTSSDVTTESPSTAPTTQVPSSSDPTTLLAPSSPTPSTSPQPFWVQSQRPRPPASSPFATSNPFNVLSNNQEVAHSESVKPPPIYIKGVTQFSGLVTDLTSVLGPSKFYCKPRLSDTMVQAETPDGYRAIVRLLKEKNVEFFTFQLKEEKAYRVVIRHLHPSTSTDLIKDELSKHGFEARNVTNVLHPVTKANLPLFFIDLEPSPINPKIFQLKELYYCKVVVEEPHKRNDIIQCMRCQNYGHSRKNCNFSYRCVKCPGQHATADCPKKDRTDPATCVLCGGSHPANYRGCEVHKKLQRAIKARNPSVMRTKPSGQPLPAPSFTPSQYPSLPSQPAPTTSALEPQPITYAAAATASTSTSTSFNIPPSRSYIPSQIPHPTPGYDFSLVQTTLQSFLTEFQKVIEPLLLALQALSSITSILPSLTNPK